MKILEFAHKKINRQCNVKRHRLCALAFNSNGHLLASATNSIHNDGVVSPYSIHAEEYLIRKLKKINASIRASGYISVLVVRLAKGKGWTMAKPCRGCEKLMRDYGIAEISYTDDSGSIKKL